MYAGKVRTHLSVGLLDLLLTLEDSHGDSDVEVSAGADEGLDVAAVAAGMRLQGLEGNAQGLKRGEGVKKKS